MIINDSLENYTPSATRYEASELFYNRCGRSGVMLPKVSLGLWHNFGQANDIDTCRSILRYAFDNGIVHFDLANNYGPPKGYAEQTFGKILQSDFKPFRDVGRSLRQLGKSKAYYFEFRSKLISNETRLC